MISKIYHTLWFTSLVFSTSLPSCFFQCWLSWESPYDRTSTTAYLVYLSGNAISWSYRKQKTMAHSSIELEHRIVAPLQLNLPGSPPSYMNLVFTTHLQPYTVTTLTPLIYVSNPIFYSHVKHIAINFHFVRDKFAVGGWSQSVSCFNLWPTSVPSHKTFA